MKKIFKYFIAPIVVLLAVVGCEEQPDVNAQWKVENEQYFLNLANSKQYEVREVSKSDLLLIRWIAKGPETGIAPKFDSTVECHYRGWNKNKEVFDQSFKGDAPSNTDTPLEARPNQLIPGFAYALTQMRPGDRCEVVIPWHLAYGAKGGGAIRPYSTLHFEIQLLRVIK